MRTPNKRWGRNFNDFSKTLKIDPEYFDSYFDRANAYFKLGNYEQAIEDLIDIEELDSERAGKLIVTARAPWFAEEEAQ